ncbi:hypothetical protein [Candidatus Soleaferrea massiliensis]|uniref:hypothetical protein n=1 Tax=Candidatus Soleaferrea massiliensis TaxID=1470354 RepID=UPI000590EA11|nr:hypothetical protein [Candidatus Soleaferrea massiliensis]
MENKFAEYFYQAASDSCLACSVSRQHSSEEFRNLRDTSMQLFQEIENKLSEADRQKLFRLEEVENHMDAIAENWVYQQGYRDCLYLLQWMGCIHMD